MKIYKVKVNSKVYEVQLEEVVESNQTITSNSQSVIQNFQSVSSGSNQVIAPIAGNVLNVLVKVGDTVKKGQTVCIIEAMKLENEIQSGFDGKVLDVKVKKGDTVSNQDILVVLG